MMGPRAARFSPASRSRARPLRFLRWPYVAQECAKYGRNSECAMRCYHSRSKSNMCVRSGYNKVNNAQVYSFLWSVPSSLRLSSRRCAAHATPDRPIAALAAEKWKIGRRRAAADRLWPVRSLPTSISLLLLALLICGRVTAFLLLFGSHSRPLGTGCWCFGCRCNENRSFCGSERRTDAIASGPLDTHLQQHICKSIRSQRIQLSESR